MATISLAWAVVSYSIRHSVFSRSGMSRRDSSRSILDRGSALVVSLCSVAPLGVAAQLRMRRRQARATLLTVGS